MAGRWPSKSANPSRTDWRKSGEAQQNVRDVIRRASDFMFHKREGDGLVRHQPLGVVALISPWNNPVAIPVGKIAPALAYGNTVVWKPAPPPAHSQAILNLLHEAGVPGDAVRLLAGDHKTAQALASDENIEASRSLDRSRRVMRSRKFARAALSRCRRN